MRLSLVTLPLWQTHLWNLRWIFSPLYMNAQFTGYLYLFFLGKFNTSHSANHSKISHLIPFLLYPRQCYQQILLNHQNPWHLCQRQSYWISSPPPELSLISWPLHLRRSCHLFPWPLYIRKTGQWILCHEFIFTQRSHIIYSLFLSSSRTELFMLHGRVTGLLAHFARQNYNKILVLKESWIMIHLLSVADLSQYFSFPSLTTDLIWIYCPNLVTFLLLSPWSDLTTGFFIPIQK